MTSFSTKCAICWRDDYNMPIRLECGHVYDLSCLRLLFAYSKLDTRCPLDGTLIKIDTMRYYDEVLGDYYVNLTMCRLGKPDLSMKIHPDTFVREIKPIICASAYQTFSPAPETVDDFVRKAVTMEMRTSPDVWNSYSLNIKLSGGTRRLYSSENFSEFDLEGRSVRIFLIMFNFDYCKDCSDRVEQTEDRQARTIEKEKCHQSGHLVNF